MMLNKWDPLKGSPRQTLRPEGGQLGEDVTLSHAESLFRFTRVERYVYSSWPVHSKYSVLTLQFNPSQMFRGALLTTLILTIMLIASAHGFRGPGGRMPSGPASSMGSSMPSASHSGGSEKCETVNGVTKCGGKTRRGIDWMFWMLVGLGVVGGLFFMKRKRFWTVRKLFKDQLLQYEQTILEQPPCKMTEKSQKQILKKMGKLKYRFEMIRKDKKAPQILDLVLNNHEHVKDAMYEVTFLGTDERGGRKLFRGLLGFTGKQMGLRVAKISEEIKTHKEDLTLGKGLVFYDGAGTHEKLTGYEYYTDAEGLKLSFGSWNIRPQGGK